MCCPAAECSILQARLLQLGYNLERATSPGHRHSAKLPLCTSLADRWYSNNKVMSTGGQLQDSCFLHPWRFMHSSLESGWFLQVTLVAESFGGCLGLRVAAAAPELVERLVLVNPATSFARALGGLPGAIAGTNLLSLFPEPLYQVEPKQCFHASCTSRTFPCFRWRRCCSPGCSSAISDRSGASFF